MQRRDGTMPGICLTGLQKGQGGEQKEGRETQGHTHTDREGERERYTKTEREGETETQTESKSQCVSSERTSRFGQDTMLLVQMVSQGPVRPLGNQALFSELPGEHTNSSLPLPCLAFESDAHMSCGWWCINDTCYQQFIIQKQDKNEGQVSLISQSRDEITEKEAGYSTDSTKGARIAMS